MYILNSRTKGCTSARRLILVDLYMYTIFPRPKGSSNLDLALWQLRATGLLVEYKRSITVTVVKQPLSWLGCSILLIDYPLSASYVVSYLREPFPHRFIGSWCGVTAVPVVGRTGETGNFRFFPSHHHTEAMINLKEWVGPRSAWGSLDKDLVLIFKADIRFRPPSSSSHYLNFLAPSHYGQRILTFVWRSGETTWIWE